MENTGGEPVIEQETGGYRYSVEPFVLSAFANPSAGQKILDVGTGNGIIPVLLLARQPDLSITAIEIQPELYRMALKNAEENRTGSALKLIQGDFTGPGFSLGQKFDLLVSNPPYRKLKSGRINPDPVKAVARHELKLDLSSLVRKAGALLKPRGKILLSYPASRLPEVLACLQDCCFTPTRLRHVHGRAGSRSKFFLVEAVKGEAGVSLREDSFCIQRVDGELTSEMKAVYVSFNHSGRPHGVG